jgi:hypothetical protein
MKGGFEKEMKGETTTLGCLKIILFRGGPKATGWMEEGGRCVPFFSSSSSSSSSS